MTENKEIKNPSSEGEAPPADDAISKLRSEFQEQFNTLKETFDAENKKNLETISKLTKENEDLHRALVRSAQLPPEQTAKEKTPEEIYQEKIIALADKSIAIEKAQRGIKT